MDKLVEDNMGLVHSTIHKYYPSFSKDEDIIQVGMLGLCKAARTWSEDKSKFSTYATSCILNEIRMEFRNRCKQPPDMYSLDYEVKYDSGDTIKFGDLIASQDDVDFVDIESVFEKLTPKEQKVFKMKLSGMSNYEISEATGHSYQMVNRMLRRAKALIKS